MVYYHVCPLVLTIPKLKLSVMVASRALRYWASPDFTDLLLLFVYWRSQPTSHFHCYICVTVPMAPVVRIEPFGSQDLLSHDDAAGDILAHGWDIFIRRFEGYNLAVAHAFT
jgi:hypothetical protein